MAFIARTRLVSKPVLQVQVRKLRFTTQNNAATRAAKAKVAREEIDQLLKLISEAEYQIDEAQAKNDLARKRIDELMREHKIDQHSNGVHEAKIVEQFTRQSRTIDPKKFKAAVASDDFWKSVSVSVGAAEQLLTEKELARVADTTPGKLVGYLLKVTKVGRTRK